MHLRRLTLLLPLLALLSGACASRGPAYDQMDADALFQYGMDQLGRRRWQDAEEAFRRFTLQFPNHPRVPEVRYRIGETFVGRGEDVTAALEFNRLAGEFPAGPWADDARFQTCQAYHRLSPAKQRYQEYTRTAIEHCNALIAYYPDSEFVPRAREIVEELTNRLAEKDYDVGAYYHRNRLYDSAIIYYELVADTYPTTPWAARALFRLHEVYRTLQYTPEAEATRARLLREHPASAEARQLGGIATGS